MYPTDQSAITYNHVPNITQAPPPPPNSTRSLLRWALATCAPVGSGNTGLALAYGRTNETRLHRSLLASPVIVSDVMADQCRDDTVCAWYMLESDAREKSIVMQ